MSSSARSTLLMRTRGLRTFRQPTGRHRSSTLTEPSGAAAQWRCLDRGDPGRRSDALAVVEAEAGDTLLLGDHHRSPGVRCSLHVVRCGVRGAGGSWRLPRARAGVSDRTGSPLGAFGHHPTVAHLRSSGDDALGGVGKRDPARSGWPGIAGARCRSRLARKLDR